MSICLHCGKLNEGHKTYCSVDHMRRHKTPERFRECLWCKTPYYALVGVKTQLYCSATCAHKHDGRLKFEAKKPMILQGIAEGMKPKHIAKDMNTTLAWVKLSCEEAGIDYRALCTNLGGPNKKESSKKAKNLMSRDQVANIIRMLRSGKRYRDVAAQLGVGESLIRHNLNAVSKRYKRWKKAKVTHKDRSIYVRLKLQSDRDELTLCDEVEKTLVDAGIVYKRECIVGIMKRRCDFLIVDGLFRYAVEAKISTRTKDADTCIGQALISSHYLKATPVCLFDSCIEIDTDAIAYCEHVGIKVCNEKNILSVLSILRKKDDDISVLTVRSKPKGPPQQNGMFWENEMQKSLWKELKPTNPTAKTLIDEGFTTIQVSQLLNKPIKAIGVPVV